MRVPAIFCRKNHHIGAVTLCGLLCVLPWVAPLSYGQENRFAPRLEWQDPFDKPEENGQFTGVEELDPLPVDEVVVRIDTLSRDQAEPATILRGRVNVEKAFEADVEFDDVRTLAKGEKLVLVLMDMLATGFNREGDVFNARVKEDVERDGEILIPRGALVRGHVVAMEEPGASLGKRGKIVLGFDYILMPDGRKVELSTEYRKGDSTLKAVGRAVGNGLGGAIGGALLGVVQGLKFGGLSGAGASNGATLIAGGSIGALAGLGRGLSANGSHVILNEGDQIQVALQEPLQLPVINRPPDTENEIHAEGLDVKITQYTLGRDPFKVEKQITLKLQVHNQTRYTFGSFDMALMDEYKNVFAVSPFGSDNMLVFRIPSKSIFTGQASFSVKSPESRHYLVFYKPYTREILAKISLTQALKDLAKAKDTPKTAAHKSKRTSLKKSDFYNVYTY